MFSPKRSSRLTAIGGLGVLVGTALIVAVGGVPARSPGEGPPAPSIDLTCVLVGSSRWSPLPGLEYTGRLSVRLPPQPGGAIVLFVSDRFPLDIEAASPEGVPLLLAQKRLHPGPGFDIPPDLWLEAGTPFDIPREVMRVTIDASPLASRLVYVRLGRRAPHVLARLTGDDAATPAEVCARPIGAVPVFGENRVAVMTAESEEHFGSGWYGVERSSGRTVRWMQSFGAVLVNAARRGRVRVRAELAPASEGPSDEATALSLVINEVHQFPARPMASGWSRYEWEIPATAWVAGTNELLFEVTRTVHDKNRHRGLGLQRVELTLLLDGD